MGGEEGNGSLLLGAHPNRLAAVAAIFGGEHQLLLDIVEIAFRPAEIVALLDLQKLLGRQVRALILVVELRPVLVELVAALLCRPEP